MQELLREAGLFSKSIHDLPPHLLLSGSKVTQAQFLSFHVVFPPLLSPYELIHEDLHLYNLNLSWMAAQVILGDFQDFEKYLGLLERGISINSISRDHSLFPPSLRTVKDLQELCLERKAFAKGTAHTGIEISARKPTRLAMKDLFGTKRLRTDTATPPVNYPDEKVEVEHEATVNSALVIFLREISSLVDNPETEFVFDPMVEKATFSKEASASKEASVSKKASFTAITDGVLRRLDTGEILAIFEVKKRDRSKNGGLIRMQEAAEMACWFKNSYRKTHFLNDHPLIISQDREKIFVSFASYDDRYIEYLQTATVQDPESRYASIQTYGPFNVNVKEDMLSFATLVVTITLAAKKRRA
ncbi:hypothetical protein Plec18170_009742 [Paecilomyces lecythidis]